MPETNEIALISLIWALDVANEALKDSKLDAESKERLSDWWDERLRRVARELESRLNQTFRLGQGVKQRVIDALSLLLLRPGHRLALGTLNADLHEYVSWLQQQKTSAELDKTGATRPRRSGSSFDVLKEQINDLEQIRSDARSVLAALQHVSVWSGSGNGTQLGAANSAPPPLTAQYNAELGTTISEITSLLRSLYQLQGVVDYVHLHLQTAYLENDTSQWEGMNQRLHGFRDLEQKEKWVPAGLETHVSYSFVNNAYADLRKHRGELERELQEAVWSIQFLPIEGEEVEAKFGDQPLGALKGRDWAEAYVHQQRTQNGLAAKSLMEHAAGCIRDLAGKAEWPDRSEYREYTRDARTRLIGLFEERTQPITLRMGWSSPSSVTEELNRRTAGLEALRQRLQAVRQFTVWQNVLKKITELAIQGRFVDASKLCIEQLGFEEAQTDGGVSTERLVTESQSVAGAIAWLDGLDGTDERSNGVPVPLLRWLAKQSLVQRQRLAAEKAFLEQLRDDLAVLDERFSTAKAEFEATLDSTRPRGLREAWRLVREGLWRRSGHASYPGQDSFQTCENIGPGSEFVIGWYSRLPNNRPPQDWVVRWRDVADTGASSDRPALEEEWQKKYLPRIVDLKGHLSFE